MRKDFNRRASHDVAFFCNTDPEPASILAELRTLPEPLDPKLTAMRNFYESLLFSAPPLEMTLESAEQAHHSESSLDSHILFLITWVRHLLHHRLQWEQMTLLNERACSMLNDQTPPPIVAWTYCLQSVIEFMRGNILAVERLINDMVSPVAPSSPHFSRLAVWRKTTYDQMGMGSSRKPARYPLPHADEKYSRRLRLFAFINSVLTGEFEDAEAHITHFEAFSSDDTAYGFAHFRSARELFEIMRAARSHAAILDSATSAPPSWALSTRHLLAGDTRAALEFARIAVDEADPFERTVVGFDEYCLIRAELATKNPNAVKQILARRQERGTVHYIDDLFHARAELLLGNSSLAAAHFTALLRAADTYRAHKRVDFELLLAREISPTAIMKLVKQATGSGGSRRRKKPDIGAVGIARIVHSSPEMGEVTRFIRAFAGLDTPVLIVGETGTGKELVARALHELSPRSGAPFVAVNCGALSDTLIESELFGHSKGAFTGAQERHIGLFEQAGSGTIFLDEIGEISPRLQVSLLRVLESGEFRPISSTAAQTIKCRVIAATNAKLKQLAEQGRFRQDLIFRLQRLEIHVPSLRERRMDILTLAAHFFNEGRIGGESAILSKDAEKLLLSYGWPGNVRELKNVIERTRLLNSDKLEYEAADIQLSRRQREPRPRQTMPLCEPGEPSAAAVTPGIADVLNSGTSAMRRLDRLRELFDKFGKMKVNEAAQILGVSRISAAKYLGMLCSEGYIDLVEPNRSTRSRYYVRKA